MMSYQYWRGILQLVRYRIREAQKERKKEREKYPDHNRIDINCQICLLYSLLKGREIKQKVIIIIRDRIWKVNRRKQWQ